MPSLLTHLDIADRCIESANLKKYGWLNTEKFLSGSIAPDLGYFNQKELLFTCLSHSRKNRKIIKELLKKSRTPEETSFSLGFLSHIISDKIMEKLINWKSDRIFNKPWYMLKKPAWRVKSPHVLHHQRIEWSLDIDILNTPRGKFLLGDDIRLPEWDTNNLVTKTYKKLFNINVDYGELAASIKILGKLKPQLIRMVSLTGLKNILDKKNYPLEKLGYHLFRRLALLAANLAPNPVHIWSFLDPYRLNQKQKKAFSRLSDRAVKKFINYLKFNLRLKNCFGS